MTKSVALLEGVLALALLIALQYAITWLAVRSKAFEDLIKSEPKLLLRQGRFLTDTLRRERVTKDDVLAAIRAEGASDVSEIAAVVLETDGSISVLRQSQGLASSLDNVEGATSLKSLERFL